MLVVGMFLMCMLFFVVVVVVVVVVVNCWSIFYLSPARTIKSPLYGRDRAIGSRKDLWELYWIKRRETSINCSFQYKHESASFFKFIRFTDYFTRDFKICSSPNH